MESIEDESPAKGCAMRLGIEVTKLVTRFTRNWCLDWLFLGEVLRGEIILVADILPLAGASFLAAAFFAIATCLLLTLPGGRGVLETGELFAIGRIRGDGRLGMIGEASLLEGDSVRSIKVRMRCSVGGVLGVGLF